MIEKLSLYEVSKDYTNYLSQFDENVPKEHDNTGLRKFVGTVLVVHGMNYFAPMSSPKPKHKKLPSGMADLFKLEDGSLGVINLNNMIPVPDSCLTEIHINEISDEKYRTLLSKQYIEINNHSEYILKKARKLHLIVTGSIEHRIKSRCCNFTLLEEKAKDYKA